MKIKLKYSSRANGIWTNSKGMDFCADILSQLGLSKNQSYTLHVRKTEAEGFTKIDLFQQTVWSHCWYWKINGVETTQPNLFLGYNIDDAITKLLGMENREGTLYFRFVKNITKK